MKISPHNNTTIQEPSVNDYHHKENGIIGWDETDRIESERLLQPEQTSILSAIIKTPNIIHKGTLFITNPQELEQARGLVKITGDIIIHSIDAADLGALSSLTEVGGNIVVQSCTLKSLHGLHKVKSAHHVLLADIGGLKNLEDLRHIKKLTSGICIVRCDDLASFSGLQGIEQINYIELAHLPKLKDVSALHVPAYIREVKLEECGDLKTVACFKNTEKIDKLTIKNMPALGSFHGFENIRTIRILTVENCNATIDCAGFCNLERIEVEGRFYNCKNLENLHGFESTKYIHIFFLSHLQNLVDASALKNCSFAYDGLIAQCHKLEKQVLVEKGFKVQKIITHNSDGTVTVTE